MGIKFENDYVGYKIKLDGDRRKYNAKNIEEAVNALKHYYLKPHNKSNCPLCK